MGWPPIEDTIVENIEEGNHINIIIVNNVKQI